MAKVEENVIILVKWCDELSGESLSSLDGYDMLGLRNVTQKYLEVLPGVQYDKSM